MTIELLVRRHLNYAVILIPTEKISQMYMQVRSGPISREEAVFLIRYRRKINRSSSSQRPDGLFSVQLAVIVNCKAMGFSVNVKEKIFN